MTRAMRRLLALALLASLVLAASASAAWVGPFTSPVKNNPADALAHLPLDEPRYDRATRCSRKTPSPGATALSRWLSRTTRGSSLGVVRCEVWGKRSASLHAEGRALDWHLEASRPADRAAARRLITLLLAPDRLGRPAALARRMGVQEIIFDCRAWFGGAAVLKRYPACARKRVDRTTAHRDHVHLGLTKAGAAKRTSFWTRRAPAVVQPPEPVQDPPAQDDSQDGWDEAEDEPLADEAAADDPDAEDEEL